MPITIRCSACRAAFRVRDELSGRKIRCVKCHEVLLVEADASQQLAEDHRGSPEAPLPASDTVVRRARRVLPSTREDAIADSSQKDTPAGPANSIVRARMTDAPKDTRVEGLRVASAALQADGSQYDTLRRKVLSAFLPDVVEPVRTTWTYRFGILMASAFMVMLPVLYLAMIVLTIVGVWYHVVYNTWIITSLSSGVSGRNAGRGVILGFLAWMTPVVTGLTVILCMLKPLFYRSEGHSGRRTLKPQDEPLLFDLVAAICDKVNAPRPSRIDVDCDINAAAGVFGGLLRFRRRQLVLVIGMPLVAGLTMRQFAGVLAHEFGHFAQGTGMSLSSPIRRVSHWFAQVVFHRDIIDERLEQWSKGLDSRLSWILYIARGGVWVTRFILYLLMIVGFLGAGFLTRQMEYDADRYEARLAGSSSFARTCRQLRLLAHAYNGAIADLIGFHSEGRLADDLPRLILQNISQLPATVTEKIDESIRTSSTGLFDSHPCDRERIASAEREGAEGVFHLALPAAQLFRSFPELSRAVTFDFYREVFGQGFRKSSLQAVDNLVERQQFRKGPIRALRRFCQADIQWFHPLPDDHDEAKTGLEQRELVEELKSCRALIAKHCVAYVGALKNFETLCERAIALDAAELMLQFGMPIESDTFSVPLNSQELLEQQRDAHWNKSEKLSNQLQAYNKIVTRRIRAGLRLIEFPGVLQKLAAADISLSEITELKKCFRLLNSRFQKVLTIRELGIRLMLMNSGPFQGSENGELKSEIRRDLRELSRQITVLRGAFEKTPYPFRYAGAEKTIAACLLRRPLVSESLDPVTDAARAMTNAYRQVFYCVTGRLAEIVETVETQFGLRALPDLPEPEAADVDDET